METETKPKLKIKTKLKIMETETKPKLKIKPKPKIKTKTKIHILISCSNKKEPSRAKAKDIYKGTLFVKSLRYARSLTSDENIFVLSAKHHLLPLEKEIEPYDLTLKKMTSIEKQRWAEKVCKMLEKKSDLQQGKFIILAGKKYYEDLRPRLKYCEVPMEGISGFDNRENWLDKNTKP